MSEWIDREKAIEDLQNGDPSQLYDMEDIKYWLNCLPSAHTEIIRCKDCRWGREACGNIECFVDINVPPEYHGYEWYCPNGERREE